MPAACSGLDTAAAGGRAAAAVAAQVVVEVLLPIVVGQLRPGRDVLERKEAGGGHHALPVQRQHRLHPQVGLRSAMRSLSPQATLEVVGRSTVCSLYHMVPLRSHPSAVTRCPRRTGMHACMR